MCLKDVAKSAATSFMNAHPEFTGAKITVNEKEGSEFMLIVYTSGNPVANNALPEAEQEIDPLEDIFHSEIFETGRLDNCKYFSEQRKL